MILFEIKRINLSGITIVHIIASLFHVISPVFLCYFSLNYISAKQKSWLTIQSFWHSCRVTITYSLMILLNDALGCLLDCFSRGRAPLFLAGYRFREETFMLCQPGWHKETLITDSAQGTPIALLGMSSHSACRALGYFRSPNPSSE